MSQFAALIRKHVIESRWLLGLLCVAFLGFGWLITWQAKRFERVVETGDLQQIGRNIRPFRFFGGQNMDGSTTALEVAWFNHPLIVLVVLSWAMARGSGAVAGEIERGTIDVTLSRPISRSNYLLSHIVYTIIGLVALLFFLIVGIAVGNGYWATKTPPNPFALMKPGLIVFTMGLAVFGYTLPLSAIDVVRWRALVVSAAITLLGLIGMSIAPMYENQDWIGKLSIFHFYAPVTVAMKTDPLAFNASVLTAVFLVGAGIAFVLFSRRDIPSNS